MKIFTYYYNIIINLKFEVTKKDNTLLTSYMNFNNCVVIFSLNQKLTIRLHCIALTYHKYFYEFREIFCHFTEWMVWSYESVYYFVALKESVRSWSELRIFGFCGTFGLKACLLCVILFWDFWIDRLQKTIGSRR